jgi:hypothetical protein
MEPAGTERKGLMKTCPFCAEELQDAAILCKHCKSDLVRNLPASQAADAGARRAIKVAAVMLAGMALVALLAATISGVRRTESPTGRTGATPPIASSGTPQDARRLQRIIEAHNESCPEVVQTFVQGRISDGTTVWNASCSNGRRFSVTGDDAKVVDCDLMKALGETACFAAFK